MHQSRLKHLYVKQLQDLYSAETELVEALPKMAEAATSPELKAGFQSHLEQTRGHVTRLEKSSVSSVRIPTERSARAWKG